MIHGDRFRQARELAGLTQEQLAMRVGLAQSTIAHVETDRSPPSAETVAAIARETNVVPSFFEQAPTAALSDGSLAFRARRSLKSVEREKARQHARLCLEEINRLCLRLNLVRLVLPDSPGNPGGAARSIRSILGSDDKPISNVINSVERLGVLVVALPFSVEELDAFSTWVRVDGQARPVIVISAGKPGDRLRFSVAHELGHVILHREFGGDTTAMEHDANRFAGELLLPEMPMREAISPSFNLTQAARLKLEWGASIQSLVKRAKDLQIISDRRYRYLFEQIGARGWRKKEPSNLDIPVERPGMFRRMVDMAFGPLDESGELAKSMHVTVGYADEVLAGYSRAVIGAQR